MFELTGTTNMTKEGWETSGTTDVGTLDFHGEMKKCLEQKDYEGVLILSRHYLGMTAGSGSQEKLTQFLKAAAGFPEWKESAGFEKWIADVSRIVRSFPNGTRLEAAGYELLFMRSGKRPPMEIQLR